MGTRVNLKSVRIDDSLVGDVDAIIIDDKLTDLLLTKSSVENSAEVQSGNEADSENMIPIGEIVYGRVVSIVDGDTYDILIGGNKTLRIRMEGIDAPEKGMPFYQVAKNFLGQLCFSKMLRSR
jgi:endonuclease YncB( thermonuclease family)